MPETLERLELINVHSEELQEIVGQSPKGMVRWGTGVLLLVILIIVGVSFFVKYADVLSGTFTLSASNAPKSVIARIDGKLQALLAAENDTVQQGQVLGYLESNASHAEVIRLSNELEGIWQNIREDKWERLLQHSPAAYKKLGELQGAYQVFSAAYIQLHAYLKDGLYIQKRKLLQQEVENLSALKQNLEEQEKVLREDYAIAEQDFKAKQALYEQKVIARLEYKQEESKFLNRQLPVKTVQFSLVSNSTASANKRQELIQLDQQFADQKSNFLQALNTLVSNADDWKRKYLLIAPVAGKVSWPVLLQEQQDVKAEQELFYITPAATTYYGEVLVAQENFGKLRVGQEVQVSLYGFPYQEFGKLRGKVSFISDFPNADKQYFVGIALLRGLQTDMDRSVHYKNGLTGMAEIITSKTRLINKFLFTIRKITDRPDKMEQKVQPATAQ